MLSKLLLENLLLENVDFERFSDENFTEQKALEIFNQTKLSKCINTKTGQIDWKQLLELLKHMQTEFTDDEIPRDQNLTVLLKTLDAVAFYTMSQQDKVTLDTSIKQLHLFLLKIIELKFMLVQEQNDIFSLAVNHHELLTSRDFLKSVLALVDLKVGSEFESAQFIKLIDFANKHDIQKLADELVQYVISQKKYDCLRHVFSLANSDNCLGQGLIKQDVTDKNILRTCLISGTDDLYTFIMLFEKYRDKPSLFTPEFLFSLVKNRNARILSYLVSNGYLPRNTFYQTNENGDTVLHVAAKQLNLPMLLRLISVAGMDDLTQNAAGETIYDLLPPEFIILLRKNLQNFSENYIPFTLPLSICIKGGGVKGLMYPDAFIEAEKMGVIDLDVAEAFTGTSAGAIIATSLAMGGKPVAIKGLLENEFRIDQLIDFYEGVNQKQIMDLIMSPQKLKRIGGIAGALKHFYYLRPILSKYQGLCKGDIIKQRCIDEINKHLLGTKYKDQGDKITFKQYRELMDIYPSLFKELRMTAWDVSNRRSIVFSPYDESVADVKIVDALRASMSIPVFFSPVKITIKENGIYKTLKLVDGGVASNYPFKEASKGYKPHEVMGFYLSKQQIEKFEDNRQVEILDALARSIEEEASDDTFAGFMIYVFESIRGFIKAQEDRHFKSKSEAFRTVHLHTLDAGTIEFNMPEYKKRALQERAPDDVRRYVIKRKEFPHQQLSKSTLNLLAFYHLQIDGAATFSQKFLSIKTKNRMQLLDPIQIYHLYRVATETDLLPLGLLVNANTKVRDVSAMDIARMNNDVETVNKLLQAGANPKSYFEYKYNRSLQLTDLSPKQQRALEIGSELSETTTSMPLTESEDTYSKTLELLARTEQENKELRKVVDELQSSATNAKQRKHKRRHSIISELKGQFPIRSLLKESLKLTAGIVLITAGATGLILTALALLELFILSVPITLLAVGSMIWFALGAMLTLRTVKELAHRSDNIFNHEHMEEVVPLDVSFVDDMSVSSQQLDQGPENVQMAALDDEHFEKFCPQW